MHYLCADSVLPGDVPVRVVLSLNMNLGYAFSTSSPLHDGASIADDSNKGDWTRLLPGDRRSVLSIARGERIFRQCPARLSTTCLWRKVGTRCWHLYRKGIVTRPLDIGTWLIVNTQHKTFILRAQISVLIKLTRFPKFARSEIFLTISRSLIEAFKHRRNHPLSFPNPFIVSCYVLDEKEAEQSNAVRRENQNHSKGVRVS